MRPLGLAVLGFLAAFLGWFLLAQVWYAERQPLPNERPGEFAELTSNAELITPNTTRVGSEDPIETAVAVSQIVYPATEAENTPGAVVLVNRDSLAEVMAAASRVQHFPINAPLLYVDDDGLPESTRSELLRLKPEGAHMDRNVQVYLVGTIADAVRDEVRGLGFRTRTLRADSGDPADLAEVLDTWTSTIHGDHENEIVIANLDALELAIPSMFWNAHAGNGLAFVTDEGIPPATRRMLDRRPNGPWLYVFGDESAVPESVVRELAGYGHVTRMPRADLVEISTFFAGFHDSGQNWGGWLIENSRAFGWGNSDAGRNAIFVNVDGPGGWQNAVVATTLSHMGKHAPVIAVERDAVPDAVRSYLELLQPFVTAPRQQLLNHGWIIGGPDTISRETQAALDLLLEARDLVAGRDGGS